MLGPGDRAKGSGDIPGELPPHTPERNLDNPPTRHTIYIFCKTSAREDNLYPLTGGLFGSHTRVEGGELLLDRNRIFKQLKFDKKKKKKKSFLFYWVFLSSPGLLETFFLFTLA